MLREHFFDTQKKINESELMRRGGQRSVCDLAERAMMNHAWNSLSTQRRRESSELARRIQWGQRERVTRQSECESVPPQTLDNTLISKIGQAWNILPDDIKQERKHKTAKGRIKSLFKEAI